MKEKEEENKSSSRFRTRNLLVMRHELNRISSEHGNAYFRTSVNLFTIASDYFNQAIAEGQLERLRVVG